MTVCCLDGIGACDHVLRAATVGRWASSRGLEPGGINVLGTPTQQGRTQAHTADEQRLWDATLPVSPRANHDSDVAFGILPEVGQCWHPWARLQIREQVAEKCQTREG